MLRQAGSPTRQRCADAPLGGRPQDEDDRKIKHYRTEIVANNVEMLSGRRKNDYAAETAAQALETQAEVMGLEPVDGDDSEDVDGHVEKLEESEPEVTAAAAA